MTPEIIYTRGGDFKEYTFAERKPNTDKQCAYILKSKYDELEAELKKLRELHLQRIQFLSEANDISGNSILQLMAENARLREELASLQMQVTEKYKQGYRDAHEDLTS